MKEFTRIITANIEITAIERSTDDNAVPTITAEHIQKSLEKLIRSSGADDVHIRNVEIKDFEMEVKE